jgi:hypothetical protein
MIAVTMQRHAAEPVGVRPRRRYPTSGTGPGGPARGEPVASARPSAVPTRLAIGAVDHPLEYEADRVADQVMRMSDAQFPLTGAPLQVSRTCAECAEEERGRTLQPNAAVAPAGATSTGTTKICSKRLEAPVLGWFFNHSYIDDTGMGNCRGNSMPGNYAIQSLTSGNFVKGCAAKTSTSTDPQSYAPNVRIATRRRG